MTSQIWPDLVKQLKSMLSQNEFNQWFSPLRASQDGNLLSILSPNTYIIDELNSKYLALIKEALGLIQAKGIELNIILAGSNPLTAQQATGADGKLKPKNFLNPNFTFDTFVEGKSNQLAKAAATQVSKNPGGSYNPLFLYGGVGLGKTHLMHSIGNHLCNMNPKAKVLYLHAERFVADLVRALQGNSINSFKAFYRSLDALLIDDIQFFAGKERSQEEFFHTFNALLEGNQQIIMTSDKYPKELGGIEERLKSRFGSGLTIAIQPPDLETRVAILINKARSVEIELSHDVAFFIAKRIRSNVRELEGALKRLVASAQFTGRKIDKALVQEALRDLIIIQDRMISMDNIIRTVAEYFKLKVTDLLAKKRTRSIARPRQIAMYLCKKLTNYSLPEIGEAFNGRDHTTVLHACRVVKTLCAQDMDLMDDLSNLEQTLAH